MTNEERRGRLLDLQRKVEPLTKRLVIDETTVVSFRPNGAVWKVEDTSDNDETSFPPVLIGAIDEWLNYHLQSKGV